MIFSPGRDRRRRPARRFRTGLNRFRSTLLGITSMASFLTEQSPGGVRQVVADRGDTVGSVDPEPGGRAVGPIHAHDGDVRAVQGGYGLEAPVAFDHLACEVGADGVRNRVVHVNEFERVFPDHIHDGRSQGQVVGRVLEEWIGKHVHHVVVEVLVVFAKPERNGIADEVNLVTTTDQVEAQLGGHHTASPERGVTDNSDTQRPPDRTAFSARPDGFGSIGRRRRPGDFFLFRCHQPTSVLTSPMPGGCRDANASPYSVRMISPK